MVALLVMYAFAGEHDPSLLDVLCTFTFLTICGQCKERSGSANGLVYYLYNRLVLVLTGFMMTWST